MKVSLEAAALTEELESLKLQVESCRFLAAGADFLNSFVDNVQKTDFRNVGFAILVKICSIANICRCLVSAMKFN